jgi:hypothetical protein
MNVVINYTKEGAAIIPVTIRMHNDIDTFFSSEFQFDKNEGSVEFNYIRPLDTICYMDLTVADARVIPDYITIIGLHFDKFWNLSKMCMSGTHMINNRVTVKDGNSIFFIGTLRYRLLPGSVANWLFT